jgi:hypothetical protein
MGLPLITLLGWMTRAAPLYNDRILRILTMPCDFSFAKARRELGYTPREFGDTIADSVRFYHEAGYL